MPTFESLSRELRQEIFRIAFTDTVADDLEFCLNTRKYICDDDLSNKLRNEYLPDFLSLALGAKAGASGLSCGYPTMAFAPSTGTTALALRQVFPDIADDIQFVLEKCLHRFEERLKENVREFRDDNGEDIYYYEAVTKYAQRAQGMGELYDRGWGLAGLDGKNVSQEMEDRFDRAVEKLDSYPSTY